MEEGRQTGSFCYYLLHPSLAARITGFSSSAERQAGGGVLNGPTVGINQLTINHSAAWSWQEPSGSCRELISAVLWGDSRPNRVSFLGCSSEHRNPRPRIEAEM